MDSRFEGGRGRWADRTGTMPILVVNTVTMAYNGLCQCCLLPNRNEPLIAHRSKIYREKMVI